MTNHINILLKQNNFFLNYNKNILLKLCVKNNNLSFFNMNPMLLYMLKIHLYFVVWVV